MYSGLLPPGLTEADLSSDDGDEGEAAENRQGEQLSRQSDTEPHSACAQVEYNNTTTGLHDAFGDDCLPGVSLDKWQVRGSAVVMHGCSIVRECRSCSDQMIYYVSNWAVDS